MFSKTSRHAIRAILFLAAQDNPEHRLGSRHIAEALGIHIPIVAKVLQEMAKVGLISSAKGPGGGFYLNEENLNNSIERVIVEMEGNRVFSECVLGFPKCSEINPCPMHVQVFAYREGLRYQLGHLSIAEMASRIRREGLKI